MADFLDEKRKEIQARLKELKPLVEEYDCSRRPRARSRDRQRHPRRARRRRRTDCPAPHEPIGGGGGRRGRPGGGTRAAQALNLVKERPGITIPELAEAMGIKQNYLYRVMPGLAEEGKVIKSGRGWHLREGVAG